MLITSDSVKGGDELPVRFRLTNTSAADVSITGCPYGGFRYGIVKPGADTSSLPGEVMTSCAAGSVVYPPGTTEEFFLTMIRTTAADKSPLPPGKYEVVIQFPSGTTTAPITIT